MIRRGMMLLLFALVALPVAASSAQPSWYVTTAPTADPNAQTRVTLGAGERTVDAGSGWSCTISPPLTFGGRTTTCRKGSEAFEFSIECSATRNNDHVQIRFRDKAGARTFIEVGCRAGA